MSLFSRDGHGPDAHVEHHAHRMPDAALEPADLEQVRRLAGLVAQRLDEGKRVLARSQHCLFNRSFAAHVLAASRTA